MCELKINKNEFHKIFLEDPDIFSGILNKYFTLYK